MAVSQVQAVINAVAEVLGDSFVAGTTVVSKVITKEEKAQVRDIVKTGILNGEVKYNKDTSDTKNFNRYVNGMINNHFIKCKKLNGGNTHVAANKRDPELKQLNTLLKTLTPNTDQYNEVVDKINLRKSELSTTKTSRNSEIDTSIAPAAVASIVDRA